MGQASVGVGNNLLYLKFLEASQSAFESSETALKAAKEALTAAKIVHVEAKAALVTATEAFKAASHQKEDFIMLLSKKGPVIDLEDD